MKKKVRPFSIMVVRLASTVYCTATSSPSTRLEGVTIQTRSEPMAYAMLSTSSNL